MATYIQIGNNIDYQNTTGKDIAHGEVVALADCIGIAASDISAEGIGVLHLTEVFELPAAGEIALGAKVGWDKTAGQIKAQANGLVPAGIAITAKEDAGEGTVWVRLAP